jgi:hypothetical protein
MLPILFFILLATHAGDLTANPTEIPGKESASRPSQVMSAGIEMQNPNISSVPLDIRIAYRMRTLSTWALAAMCGCEAMRACRQPQYLLSGIYGNIAAGAVWMGWKLGFTPGEDVCTNQQRLSRGQLMMLGLSYGGWVSLPLAYIIKFAVVNNSMRRALKFTLGLNENHSVSQDFAPHRVIVPLAVMMASHGYLELRRLWRAQRHSEAI